MLKREQVMLDTLAEKLLFLLGEVLLMDQKVKVIIEEKN